MRGTALREDLRARIAAKAQRPGLARHSPEHCAMMRKVRALGGGGPACAPRNAIGKQNRDCPRWHDCFDLAARLDWRGLSCEACKGALR